MTLRLKVIAWLVAGSVVVGAIKSGYVAAVIHRLSVQTKNANDLAKLIQNDDFPRIVEYVEAGRPINATINQNQIDRRFQPFIEACQAYDSSLAWYLLKHGADPKARDSSGNTALHGAAQGQSTRLIDELVRLGVDVNAANNQGKTPLDSMLNTNMVDREIAYRIYQHGGRTKNPDYRTASTSSRLMTNPQTLGIILAYSIYGSRSFAEKLISEGVDPNANCYIYEESLLAMVVLASDDKPYLLRLLLEKGADPNQVVVYKKRKMPILHVACELNKSEAVRLLLKHRANPHLKDGQGRTAFEVAESAGGSL